MRIILNILIWILWACLLFPARLKLFSRCLDLIFVKPNLLTWLWRSLQREVSCTKPHWLFLTHYFDYFWPFLRTFSINIFLRFSNIFYVLSNKKAENSARFLPSSEFKKTPVSILLMHTDMTIAIKSDLF